ncbi:DUF4139 domain-containing protein [Lewinella sp. IMCC34183]|uniref:DUF4139 domain-containing protein n=1 Tax=Lewinella sp. IMCC34183 TaxID=2248762 RepID=UPI000E2506BC|nr:DUF4139 domain-containing protein [Lewinella sp. IMCC34183]
MPALITLLLLLHCTCALAQEISLPSRIEHVTVYREGAEITRAAALRSAPGRQTLVFTGLTEHLVEKSIRVSSANPDLLILSVRYRPFLPTAPEASEESRSLEGQLEELAGRERQLRTRLGIGEEEEAVLAANRDLGGTDTGLAAEDLERGVAYHRRRLTEIRLERLALTDSLRTLEEQRRSLAEARALVLADTTTAGSEVVVEVRANRDVSDSLRLTYLVAAAGWDPVYDLRVSELDQPLDFSYRALVRQQSGEDWDRVRLTLSTGNPARSNRTPELQTWHLAPYLQPPTYDLSDPGLVVTGLPEVTGRVTDDSGTALIGATVAVVGSSSGTVTDLDGNYTLKLSEGARQLRVSYAGYTERTVDITGDRMNIQLFELSSSLEEVVVVGYGRSQNLVGQLSGQVAGLATRSANAPPSVPVTVEQRPTTRTYTIDLTYTIPDGGSERSVEVQRFRVPATYRHVTVPKVDPRVYLSATVHDWERYELLSGDVQLIVGGTYLGSSRLDVDQTADSLVFSLGVDPDVVIRREPAERFVERGGLFGNKREVWRGWELRARNTKGIPVDLTVIDQVPVSADGSVSVESEIDDSAAYDPETGELQWRLNLAPGTEWTAEFGYRVRYSTSGPLFLE